MPETASELLRFSTAGSVDDGKSTLIGRLLYEAKGVYEDQMDAVKKSKINRAGGERIDFSLLTDGLRAEREQGITIDVAYRYFSTPRRKFIIADTPGHEQYTRNMATGSSTADLAIVLIDARKGVLPQSRRHAYISSLLGITHTVVAVNKMDLVDFSKDIFYAIQSDFQAFASQIGLRNLLFLPMSALEGDNVVERSPRTPWYEGPPLLEHLETVPLSNVRNLEDLRFPVQYVIRPNLDFRGFAGTIASGAMRPGDTVMAIPSGRITKVKSLPTREGDREVSYAPMDAVVTLEDEIDLGRGDMLVDPRKMPHVSRRVDARMVWMHADAMEVGKTYLLKHTTRIVPATVTSVRYKVDVNSLAQVPVDKLELNEIAAVRIETTKPLYYDSYAVNRTTGAFILIDPLHNGTVAAGMLEDLKELETAGPKILELEPAAGAVTPAERTARNGHQPAVVWLTARRELAQLVERRLFEHGCQVALLSDETEAHVMPEVARVLTDAGVITICVAASASNVDLERSRALTGADRFFVFAPEELAKSDEDAAAEILKALEAGLIVDASRFSGGGGI